MTIGSRDLPGPDAKSVAAIVITFHPNEPLTAWLPGLLNQVATVIVVDNASCADDLGLDATAEGAGNVEVIRNETNVGVAAALNQGMRRARDLGYAWALTMDQDSRACPNLVSAAGRAFDMTQAGTGIAAIGAARTEQCDGSAGDQVAYRRVPAVITSGSLHSVAAWEELGGFSDEFFVDFVDTEFCLRARVRGWRIIEATEPGLRHRIGSPTRKRALGRWMIPSNHSAFRRYYMTRNRVVVWRRYARTDFRFVVKDLRQAVRELIGVLFAEEQRPDKVRAIAVGALDGLLGRLGPRRAASSPHSPFEPPAP